MKKNTRVLWLLVCFDVPVMAVDFVHFDTGPLTADVAAIGKHSDVTENSAEMQLQSRDNQHYVPKQLGDIPQGSFFCDDGCEILAEFFDDDWCDCTQCEDEPNWSCGTCPGCPLHCGDYVFECTFQCDDGCRRPVSLLDNGYCDCGECEDEADWSCDTCACTNTCDAYGTCEYNRNWTIVCTNPEEDIGDHSSVTASFDVSNFADNLDTLFVYVDIVHSFLGDLSVYVEHENTRRQVLGEGMCDSKEDLIAFFSDVGSENVCEGNHSNHSIYDAVSYQSLADFKWLPKNGLWNVIVEDDSDGDVGTLEAVCIGWFKHSTTFDWEVCEDRSDYIGDQSTVTVPFDMDSVPNHATGLFVYVDLEHTYLGDLEISVGNGNTTKYVFNHQCASSNDLRAYFSDGGTEDVCVDHSYDKVYNASSYESLTDFNSQPKSGVWNVFVTDTRSSDTGTVKRVCLGWGNPAIVVPTTTTMSRTQCFDGCLIDVTLIDDGACDCSQCEDESNTGWNCTNCEGCPQSCGERVVCSKGDGNGNDSGSNLSGGAIAGIVISVLALICCLLAFAVYRFIEAKSPTERKPGDSAAIGGVEIMAAAKSSETTQLATYPSLGGDHIVADSQQPAGTRRAQVVAVPRIGVESAAARRGDYHSVAVLPTVAFRQDVATVSSVISVGSTALSLDRRVSAPVSTDGFALPMSTVGTTTLGCDSMTATAPLREEVTAIGPMISEGMAEGFGEASAESQPGADSTAFALPTDDAIGQEPCGELSMDLAPATAFEVPTTDWVALGLNTDGLSAVCAQRRMSSNKRLSE